jgi:hypothetical protein
LKLKDYTLPDSNDLKQYDLKNFDLASYDPNEGFTSAPEEVISPDPIGYVASTFDPYLPTAEPVSPAPSADQGALEPFGVNPYAAQPPSVYLPPVVLPSSFEPFSPERWKMPRWAFAMVGVFLGSVTLLVVLLCVVVLRGSNAAPAVAPTAPMAAVVTPAAPAQPNVSPVVATNKAPSVVAQPVRPATASPMQASAAALGHSAPLGHRRFVRRQPVAHRGSASAATADEAEAPSRAQAKPAPDALDQLLSESSL